MSGTVEGENASAAGRGCGGSGAYALRQPRPDQTHWHFGGEGRNRPWHPRGRLDRPPRVGAGFMGALRGPALV